LYVAGVVQTYGEGVSLASRILDEGKGAEVLRRLRESVRWLGGSAARP